MSDEGSGDGSATSSPDELLPLVHDGTLSAMPCACYAARDYFDVWLPTLAPSRELLSRLKNGDLITERFLQRYRREMRQTDPRQVIALLAALAARTPMAVGCYCADESQCHRSVLIELIREAGGQRA